MTRLRNRNLMATCSSCGKRTLGPDLCSRCGGPSVESIVGKRPSGLFTTQAPGWHHRRTGYRPSQALMPPDGKAAGSKDS
jgi:predicted amidophosphoribosyltransferase